MSRNDIEKCLVKIAFDKNIIFRIVTKFHTEQYGCAGCNGYEKSKICYMTEKDKEKYNENEKI
jgi:hypothetical protein